MNRQRYDALSKDESLSLTEEEFTQGWHFCYDWDGLLIHPTDPEFSCCTCLPEDHPAKKKV